MQIAGYLREECKKAKSKYDDHRKTINSEKMEQNEEMNKKREKVGEELRDSIGKKKENIANKANYFAAQLEPVYEHDRKKKKVDKGKLENATKRC